MKISPICFYNQKHLQLSFNARHKIESESVKASNNDVIIHVSKFFREPFTDKFVQNYVLENFSKNKDINIVSAGCSQGEEAYSYYVMLDDLKDKLKVSGFDLSDKIISDAKKGIFSLKFQEQYLVDTGSWMNLSNYERKCREKFHKHFEPVDESFYNEAPYNIYPRHESSIYKLKENEKGCEFKQGDVLNIDKMYKEKSVDVLLFRNTLYHLLCKVSDPSLMGIGEMKHDAPKIIDSIAQKMNKVIKKGGLVVFGENEESQRINADYITDAMEKNGFKPIFLYDNPAEYMKLYAAYYNYSKPYSHVWKKVSD